MKRILLSLFSSALIFSLPCAAFATQEEGSLSPFHSVGEIKEMSTEELGQVFALSILFLAVLFGLPQVIRLTFKTSQSLLAYRKIETVIEKYENAVKKQKKLG